MSSNSEFIFDEDGDDEDWIEIYNAEPFPVNLLGYSLSDKADNLNMWSFPDTVISGGSFLLVWASGKNRTISGNELHTNFSIKASGEAVFLSLNGLSISQAPEEALSTNQTLGLIPNGSHPYVVIDTPTPDSSNNNATHQIIIDFSHPGGIYDDAFELDINTSLTGPQIRYTTNGNAPSSVSDEWTNPMFLSQAFYSTEDIHQFLISPSTGNYHYPQEVDKTIIIRAAAFDSDGNSLSKTYTNTYLIRSTDNRSYSLPVVSIAANYDDLFDEDIGIFIPGVNWNANDPGWTGNYYMRGDNWERNINFEYYRAASFGINQSCGLRTHGGNSRRHTQKGMRIYARNEYGLSEFDYPVFSDRPMESYKRLVLKPIMSSWTGSGVEDYFANQLVKKVDVDRVAARPVEVFLNGEYWGVYTLQERVDARYIEANTGIPRDEVDMIDHWSGQQVSAGDNEEFLDLYAFIEDNDLTIPANYDAVKERIDLNSFIDYQLFEIYIGNYDWPSNNMKCYRAKHSDAKWRWIFFDGDASLNGADFDAIQHAFSESTTSWNTGAYSTLFLRKLHENNEFRDLFYQRLEQLLKVDFQQNQTEQIMDNTTELISHKMPFYHSRFYDLNNTPDWYENMENHYLFLEERACSLAYFAKVNHDENILVSECPEVHLKIEGVQIQPTPNFGNFYLTLESDKKTHGNIKIYNLLGALVHEDPHIEVNVGNNYHLITLPNAPAGVLYIHFMMDNKVYKLKTLVL